MTVEQFISDLDELVDVVCMRLGATKVVLFGHSWGSALGVLYAAHFPQKLAAYVGRDNTATLLPERRFRMRSRSRKRTGSVTGRR